MCTGIKITAKNGDIFFGRTMDLNISMFGEDPGLDGNVKITSIPKNTLIDSQLDSWTSKYSIIGVGTKDTPILYDGINEHGLAGDTQVLMEATRSSKAAILEKGNIPILGEEFVTYILTNFKSVAEIRAHYMELTLVDQPYIFQGTPLQFPLHYSFIDRTGEGIVLEPVIDGSFKIYDYLGVMTNSPEYDYHTVNIRNYIGLENESVVEKKINEEITLLPIENGTGYGLLGIPGDYTSPSRFIRSFFYKNLIDEFESAKGFNTLYAIFRPLIIPRGLGREKRTDLMSDYTRFWSGYDLSNCTLVVQTGMGLSFTSKTLDTNETTINYYDIDTEDHLNQL